MARHDDDYRFRNRTSRFEGDRHYSERNGSHRDLMSGSRAGEYDDDDSRPGAYGSGDVGRGHGGEREDGSRWFGRPERRDRYGSYEGERGDSRSFGRYGERAEEDRRYGGRSTAGGRSSDQDVEGISGGARGGYEGRHGSGYEGRYGGEYGSAYAEDYSQRGMAGSGMYGRSMSDGPGNGGHYGGEAMYDRGIGAGRYGSEHAGRAGGYGIGASPGYHGEHHGKGPKGYTRSDDRIKEDVCDCLTDDPMLDAGDIEVQVKNGEVTLSGSVKDRLAKRHAEDMIERVSGVKNVQNSLKVKEQHRQRGTPHLGSGQSGNNQTGGPSAQSGGSQGKTQSGASRS
jgi:hypothetical protein